jgi:peptidoglycan/LPS O-acetylase OafA/YrhL
VTLTLATLSWYLVEQPALRLKKRAAVPARAGGPSGDLKASRSRKQGRRAGSP